MQFPEANSRSIPTVSKLYTDADLVKLRKQNSTMYQSGQDLTPLGSTSFYKNGHAVIRLFQSTDTSTAIHEMFHVLRREIERTAFEADSAAANKR
ncbi:MAG: hypothetical protein IJU79_05465 [Desulfovibrionaceae bacterium]|nr:hypothetical protein [Desulfovibrionaceae bacterium]